MGATLVQRLRSDLGITTRGSRFRLGNNHVGYRLRNRNTHGGGEFLIFERFHCEPSR